MKFKPYSSTSLAFGGLLLAAIGVYFLFLRPALLPEDLRYMGTTLKNIEENVPGISGWLQKVFWVMGGYIFTTGLLTVYISFTSFRARKRGVFSIATIVGISSIGLMTAVNFMIDSNFKWVLLVFTLPWVFALILYLLHK